MHRSIVIGSDKPAIDESPVYLAELERHSRLDVLMHDELCYSVPVLSMGVAQTDLRVAILE